MKLHIRRVFCEQISVTFNSTNLAEMQRHSCTFRCRSIRRVSTLHLWIRKADGRMTMSG